MSFDSVCRYKSSSSDILRKDSALPCSLRDTFKDLCKTTDSYSPFDLIRALRSFAPQFAQQAQGHFAQQDAEECWGQIVGAIRSTLDASGGIDGKFVDRYMTGEMTTEFVRISSATDHLRVNDKLTLNFDIPSQDEMFRSSGRTAYD